ncbi:MAG: tRNA 2-thiocytidine(32) synthetase TtcA [Erysipelotrichia bacterium]|nr:tRNA 2-thiocytidine(32) synthetase TtcA [Erysipelotrichia bacterium]NCC55257.1 tRNA 2-thiocytidine(32) synthetase TtcA [Erysipelotrichia bacterium]
MQNILKYLRKGDEDFHLIEKDDVIVVGVSGGKDSMLLLKALAIYRQFANKQFKLIAVHMKMGFPNMESEPIKQYAKDLKVDYYEENVPIYDILQHYLKEDGSVDCSRCSSLKRGAIVSIAQKLNANKIAFAHHGDDAIETFFLNAIYSGKMNSFQPKIQYEDKQITFIRPFIYLQEKQIMKASKKEAIVIVKSTCPKDQHSKRSEIKRVMNELYERFPSAQHNFLKMLSDEKATTWKKEK